MALGRSLRAAKLEPADAALLELARTYARAVDAADISQPVEKVLSVEPLSKVGKALLDSLVELGMTPKVRAGLLKYAKPEPQQQADPLDELRRRREERSA